MDHEDATRTPDNTPASDVVHLDLSPQEAAMLRRTLTPVTHAGTSAEQNIESLMAQIGSDAYDEIDAAHDRAATATRILDRLTHAQHASPTPTTNPPRKTP